MTTEATERTLLETADQAVAVWMDVLREEADKLDGGQVDNFADTMRRLITRLGKDLGPLDFDPEALAEIRGIILDGIEYLDTDGEKLERIDVLDDLLVRGEKVRHIIRDVLDGDVGVDSHDAKAVVSALTEWLPRVPQREIADLSGISVRQLQRWGKEGGDAPRRLRLVARLVALLRRAWTPEGVVAWFDRPRQDLDGRRPLDLLDDPGEEQAVLRAVRQGRAQHG